VPIKRSSLEEKWPYRLGKTILLALPLLILLWLLSRKKMIACGLTADFSPDLIVFAVVAVILYYVFLALLSRGFFYVAFGGVEEDRKKERTGGDKTGGAATGSETGEEKKSPKPDPLLPLILLFVLVAVYFLIQGGYIKLSKTNFNGFNFDGGATTCRRTSAEWGKPCHSNQPGGVAVSGLAVPASCDCPVDTTFAQMDNITAGGPYRICVCD
jgi:hypothetical protein